jgi:hypothetical protein
MLLLSKVRYYLKTFLKDVCKSKSALLLLKLVHLLIESFMFLNSFKLDEYIGYSITSNLSFGPTTDSSNSFIFFSSLSE